MARYDNRLANVAEERALSVSGKRIDVALLQAAGAGKLQGRDVDSPELHHRDGDASAVLERDLDAAVATERDAYW